MGNRLERSARVAGSADLALPKEAESYLRKNRTYQNSMSEEAFLVRKEWEFPGH